MPRGNQTGPAGQGPQTGRGLGNCSGYDSPGFTRGTPRGGAGFGRGNGTGRGPGKGHRRGVGRRASMRKSVRPGNPGSNNRSW